MDLNDFYVEVARDDGVWYKALVHEFSEDGIEITFPGTQLPTTTVRYDQVRPVPVPPAAIAATEETKKPAQISGDRCEIQLVAKENNSIGWVAATVKDARGDFFVVEYKLKNNEGVETVHNDIVPSERIRPINNQDTMTPGCLFRYRVYPNENLEELFKATDDKSHKILKEPLSPARLYFNKATKELILLTDSPTCLKRATMMIDMHLKCMDIKSSIIRRSKGAMDRIKHSSGASNAPFSCEFQLPESLMGLAIGTHGTNITTARRIPGVTHIETDRNSNTFRIFGENEEAIRKARSMLEFEHRSVMIPRSVIGRVIGKNGATIQNIVDRSQVLEVKVEGDKDRNESEEDKIPLVFTGTVESIENAKILLDFYIAHILEIDELNDKLRKVVEEVNKHAHGSGGIKTASGHTSYFHGTGMIAPSSGGGQIPHMPQRMMDFGGGMPQQQHHGTIRGRQGPYVVGHNQPHGMYRGGAPSGGSIRQQHQYNPNMLQTGPMGMGQMSHFNAPRHLHDGQGEQHQQHHHSGDFHPRAQRRPRNVAPQRQMQQHRQYGSSNQHLENGLHQQIPSNKDMTTASPANDSSFPVHQNESPVHTGPSTAHPQARQDATGFTAAPRVLHQQAGPNAVISPTAAESS